MNPILPLRHFVPDVEARVWDDGRLYLYGSYDISGNTTYCSHEYHVFSTGDLVDWIDHGESFDSKVEHGGGPWSRMPLYAPDCVSHNGQYYLYFCLADGGEGVATSLHPYGPFRDPMPVLGADGTGIDPSVFIDDDGQVYYFWGQFQLKAARMNPDMRSMDMDTFHTSVITEKEHGFHEGASVRKRNGIYYLVYTDISRGRATCLSYATSTSPFGPYIKKGVIIDNTGCDPETWNNHGSIAEFCGQWYVFYHRSSQNSQFNRRVCMEPIAFREDGTIEEVQMTTQGAGIAIKAVDKIRASSACTMKGTVYIEPVDGTDPQEECLSHVEHGDFVCYREIDFGSGVDGFTVDASSSTLGGMIEIILDKPDGPVIGSCIIGNTGGWQRHAVFAGDIDWVSGTHSVYLAFKGGWGRLFDLHAITFRLKDRRNSTAEMGVEG